MKSITEVLLNENINDESGIEVNVPKGAEVISISVDDQKGWSPECYFYKLEQLLSGMEGSSKEEEIKKALSKVGATYLVEQGKSKNLLIRFK